MRKHAKLPPSSAERWINCPGSIALTEDLPAGPSSPYADEGTIAHLIAENKLMLAADMRTKKEYKKIDTEARQSEYWCGEMEEATDFYRDSVLEIWHKAGASAELMVEQQFKLDKWVLGSFGTSDAVVISDNTIEVVDLKYGKGIRVEAKANPQLRLYGLGAADLFSDLYEFDTVRMTIIQPRLDHISTEEMPLRELLTWAEDVVKPRATMAAEGTDYRSCGDWCRWCPAKAICRTRAEYNLELARYDFADPGILADAEIGDILRRADELQKWASDVSDYALQQAIAGKHFNGWKLVEGRSVRKYADDQKVVEALQAAGYPEAALYERKLYGITAMEKIVGKKKLTETLGELIIKPAGKPVLVPESDKREAINDAKRDFMEE